MSLVGGRFLFDGAADEINAIPIVATVVASSAVVGQIQFMDGGFICNYGGQGTIDPTIQKLI